MTVRTETTTATAIRAMARQHHLIVVVHTWREMDPHRTAVRIISARRPTRNEARQYREDPTA
jgi:uncharacterized DUF497 family protein